MTGVPIFTESPISSILQAPRVSTDAEPSPTFSSSSSAHMPNVNPIVSAPLGPTSKLTSAAETGATSQDHSAPTSSSTVRQPGSLPTSFATSSRASSPGGTVRHVPPPPKVGEKMQPAAYYSPVPTPTQAAQPSYQVGVDSGSSLRAVSKAYVPNTPHSRQGDLLSPFPNGLLSHQESYESPVQTPTTAGAPPRSFEHPPGYIQNSYAADLTPEQRFSTQHRASSQVLGYKNTIDDTNGSKSPIGVFGGLSGLVSPGGKGPGILNGDEDDDKNILAVASDWLKVAGKKMTEVEGEVWRRINGE